MIFTYTIISALVAGGVGFIFEPERTWEHAVGRTLVMGIVLGTLFYFLDRKKSQKNHS